MKAQWSGGTITTREMNEAIDGKEQDRAEDEQAALRVCQRGRRVPVRDPLACWR